MRKTWSGIIGLIIAMAGLAATIIAFHFLPEPPPPKLQTSVNVSIGGLNLGWKSKIQVPEPPPPSPLFTHERVRLIGVILGALALPFAILSWVRRERPWLGFAVCSFAIAVLAWQTFVIVFAVLLLLGVPFAFIPTWSKNTSESN